MKLLLDERIKHRLVGLMVVISITAIFVPAVLKKSNHRFASKNMNVVSIRLPEKPPLPKVEVPSAQALFKRDKVAQVDISKARAPVESLAAISKAKRLSQAETLAEAINKAPSVLPELPKKSQLAALPMASKKTEIAAKPLKTKPSVANTPKVAERSQPKLSTAKTASRRPAYAVQLAMFSEKSNALSLVTKLNAQGYQAHFVPIKTSKGQAYKVLVGQLAQKQDANLLQKKLLAAVQLNGFVVAANQLG